MAEDRCRECTKSNVIGSLNILEEAVNNNVEFVLGISTDKAAQIAGVYGATKYVMEKLFQQFEENYPEIDFRIVRYGNVLYSTGSVLSTYLVSILSQSGGLNLKFPASSTSPVNTTSSITEGVISSTI